MSVPITFTWDPIAGMGVGGPSATLCRTHEPGDAPPNESDARVEVVGGWLGRAWNADAKVWTVLTTVYETRDALTTSKHWYALRRPMEFGVCDDATYDEVSGD